MVVVGFFAARTSIIKWQLEISPSHNHWAAEKASFWPSFRLCWGNDGAGIITKTPGEFHSFCLPTDPPSGPSSSKSRNHHNTRTEDEFRLRLFSQIFWPNLATPYKSTSSLASCQLTSVFQTLQFSGSSHLCDESSHNKTVHYKLCPSRFLPCWTSIFLKSQEICDGSARKMMFFQLLRSSNVPMFTKFPHHHPGRLTWNLQITHLDRKMIFQTSVRTCSSR